MYNLTAKYRILELCDCEMNNFITEFNNVEMIVLMQNKRNELAIC